jgi:hypothetical protein
MTSLIPQLSVNVALSYYYGSIMGVLWEPLLAFSQYASHSRAIGINANTPVLAQLLAFSQYAVPAIAFLFTLDSR